MEMGLPYRLVEAWPRAWGKYQGSLSATPAIPGIVLGCEAGHIKEGDQTISRGNYWSSRKRADLNLALLECESAGWLAKQQQPAPALWDCFIQCLAWPWGGYESASLPDRGSVPRVLSQHPGLDNEWWSLTHEGRLKLRELESPALEQKKPRLGFRTQKGSESFLSGQPTVSTKILAWFANARNGS